VRFRAEFIAVVFLAVLVPAPGRAQLSKTAPLELQKPANVQLRTLRPLLPTIASVEPAGCVTIGGKVKIVGANFGDPATAGYSLGVQVGINPIIPVTDPYLAWSATSIELKLTLPATAGLAAGSPFTLGIVNDKAFVAKTEIMSCAPAPVLLQKTKTDLPVSQPIRLPVGAPQITTETPKVSSPLTRKSAGATLTKTSQLLTPKITSVTPSPCVRAGKTATLNLSNFGSTKPEGASLVVKTKGGSATTVADASWSSSGVSFTVPASLAAGSSFTAEVFSGGAAVVSASLQVCPMARTRKKTATRVTGKRVAPVKFKAKRLPARRGLGSGLKLSDGDSETQPADSGWPPEITSVSSSDCVDVGAWVTAFGVNLGTSKQNAGFLLATQVDGGATVPTTDKDWSPTSIKFVVPQGAESAGWFALGIVFESEFYPQQYVWLCSAYSGEEGSDDYSYESGDFDSGGYESGGQDYGDSQHSGNYQGAGGNAGPKGARRLGPGVVNIQIEPSPAPAPEPPPSGKRAVGGKLLAMKALVTRGLIKVNKECDLYDPHCPCCRKDDSVCLEKESDNENGSSAWVVRWKAGAKSADGSGPYNGRSAEDDLEAVTGLQCEPAGGAAAGSSGIATLVCR